MYNRNQLWHLSAAAIAACAALAPPHADARKLTTFYAFTGKLDGGNPHGTLIDVGGALYGTTETGGTSGAGTVFKIDLRTHIETVLYSFNGKNDGATPAAGLLYQRGLLYGTTMAGGTSGVGTVFAVNPATGSETVLHSFKGFADGDTPVAGLIYQNGKLYGTTEFGGGGAGTVFKVDLTSHHESVLFVFGLYQGDGDAPLSGLTYHKGILYGTTENGGHTLNGAKLDSGTVFAVDATSGAEQILYSFGQNGGLDGQNPWGGVIFHGGALYGTTYYATDYEGHSYYGTVFKLNPSTGAETILYPFNGESDGGFPFPGVIEHDGALYGAGSFAGQGNCGGSGCGVIFKVNPVTGAETVLHSFTGADDGGNPEAGLLLHGGALYGTTFDGGASGFGTVFKLTP